LTLIPPLDEEPNVKSSLVDLSLLIKRFGDFVQCACLTKDRLID